MNVQRLPPPYEPHTGQLEARVPTGKQLYRWLLYTGVGISPFINVRSDYAFFTISDALLLICFLILMLRSQIKTGIFGYAGVLWISSYYLLVFGLFISSFLYGDVIRGAILFAQYSFCIILLPFVLMREPPRRIHSMIVAFVSGVVVLDLHGIYTFFMIGYVPGSQTVTGGLRLATLVADANGAACLNAMTIIVTLWLGGAGHLRRSIALVFVSVMGLATVLTSSNSGLIALGAGLGFYLLSTLSLRSFVGALILVALVVTAGYLGGTHLLPATFQKRVMLAVSSGNISEAGTFASRRDLMIEALDMIEEKKVGLLGIGADQFRVFSVRKTPVHNAFLIVWVEGGVIALLGWIGLYVTSFVVWYVERVNESMRAQRAAMISCFFIFAVMANSFPHIYSRHWYVLLLMLLGPLLNREARVGAYLKQVVQRRDNRRRRRLSPTIGHFG